MTLKSVASSHGFRVVGRVQSEEYEASELCKLIQEDPEAKIEKFLIAVNDLDSADARKVTETFEEAGVIYATNAGDFSM